MIVHINNLKEYYQEEATVLRIVVATEDIAEGIFLCLFSIHSINA